MTNNQVNTLHISIAVNVKIIHEHPSEKMASSFLINLTYLVSVFPSILMVFGVIP